MSIQEIKEALTVESLTDRINANNCSVKNLAIEIGAKQSDVRAVLNEYFGNRIIFKRGRNGGVRWNAVQNS